jgi:RecA-family ATPase
LVDRYVPQPSFILLLGEAKSGKSFLALQLALAVAQGTTFLKQPARPAPVLYLQVDTSELVWRDRLVTLHQSGCPITGPLYFLHPEDQPVRLDILALDTQRHLRHAIAQVKPGLIVVDVLRELHGKREDSSGDMQAVVAALKVLAEGASLVVLHHTPKLSNREQVRVIDLARGSSYLVGAADAVWCLLEGHLHIVPRFGEQEVLTLHREPNGLWCV